MLPLWVDSKLFLNKLSPFIMKDIHHAIELKTSSTQSKRRDPLQQSEHCETDDKRTVLLGIVIQMIAKWLPHQIS